MPTKRQNELETSTTNDVLKKRLTEIRHVALDLDGTLYVGGTLFEFTLGFIQTLRQLGIGCTFLTNNSSQSDREYVVKLNEMGIEAELGDIYTSASGTIDYLRHDSHLKDCKRLFVLGTQGLQDQFTQAGFTVCDTEPEVVVIGFDTGLVYDRLALAAYWIQQGKPYLATHPDLVCPTDQPLVLPDCGAICQLLQAATGRLPDAVLGKPNVAMLDGIRQRLGLDHTQIAMVGDRLYTDIAMARSAGILGVLVLTGEAQLSDLEGTADRPDMVVANVGQLGRMLVAAKSSNGDEAVHVRQ
jgi:HAD superfamily hydrolase (TIGR01450 family)